MGKLVDYNFERAKYNLVLTNRLRTVWSCFIDSTRVKQDKPILANPRMQIKKSERSKGDIVSSRKNACLVLLITTVSTKTRAQLFKA